MTAAEIDSAIILWREVLRFIIRRMTIGLEENGMRRKANRKEVGDHLQKGSLLKFWDLLSQGISPVVYRFGETKLVDFEKLSYL